jgi:hypothetical protein
LITNNLSFALTKTQHELVFNDLRNDLLSCGETDKNPIIVLVGGQPGAGKSNLLEFSRKEMDKNSVTINGDDYRHEHLYFDQITSLDDKLIAERTDPDVRVWTRRLLETAVEHRFNIIFETTLRQPEPIMTTIKWLFSQAYSIEVKSLAVHREYSELGIQQRYEDQKEVSTFGRWTFMKDHDEAYDNLPINLDLIEKYSPIDKITLYNRNCGCIYKNSRKQNGLWSIHPGEAGQTIFQHRYEPLNSDTIRDLLDCWNHVLKQKKLRKASSDEIDMVNSKINNLSDELNPRPRMR